MDVSMNVTKKMAILTNVRKKGDRFFNFCGRAWVGAVMNRQVLELLKYNFHFIWGPF